MLNKNAAMSFPNRSFKPVPLTIFIKVMCVYYITLLSWTYKLEADTKRSKVIASSQTTQNLITSFVKSYHGYFLPFYWAAQKTL